MRPPSIAKISDSRRALAERAIELFEDPENGGFFSTAARRARIWFCA